MDRCACNGYPRAVHTPEGFARARLGDPRAQAKVLKAPPSLTVLSKLAAVMRMPVAAAIDARDSRRRKKRSSKKEAGTA